MLLPVHPSCGGKQIFENKFLTLARLDGIPTQRMETRLTSDDTPYDKIEK
jgi:hypothetical protein